MPDTRLAQAINRSASATRAIFRADFKSGAVTRTSANGVLVFIVFACPGDCHGAGERARFGHDGGRSPEPLTPGLGRSLGRLSVKAGSPKTKCDTVRRLCTARHPRVEFR